MNLTSWNDLLERTRRRYRDEEIAGCRFRIQSLTGLEWSTHCRRLNPDDEEASSKKPREKQRDNRDFIASLLSICLVDEDGNLLCPLDGEWTSLRELDTAISEPLATACMEHIGFRTQKALEKNSVATETPDST